MARRRAISKKGHIVDVPLLLIPQSTEEIVMLKRKTPETLAAEITIEGQGEAIKFNVTYNNRRQSDVNDLLQKRLEETDGDYAAANRSVLLFMLQGMDTEYELTEEGIAEMEADRPGIIEALFYGFHRARKVELGKN
jgi:hypothetical protein